MIEIIMARLEKLEERVSELEGNKTGQEAPKKAVASGDVTTKKIESSKTTT